MNGVRWSLELSKEPGFYWVAGFGKPPFWIEVNPQEANFDSIKIVDENKICARDEFLESLSKYKTAQFGKPLDTDDCPRPTQYDDEIEDDELDGEDDFYISDDDNIDELGYIDRQIAQDEAAYWEITNGNYTQKEKKILLKEWASEIEAEVNSECGYEE